MDSTHKNTEKGLTLEEKYVNLTDQLSSVTERLDHAEHDLDLERISREDIILAEIERRMAEERKKLEEEYAEKVRLVEQEKKEHEEMLQRKMEKHEADLKTTYANMTQKVIADACRQVEEARQKAESNGIAKMAAMMESFIKAFVKMTEGNIPEGQTLLKQYQDAAKEAEATLKEELKEALGKAEKKAVKKSQHIASLVRMLFTQKSERFIITEEEREPLLQSVIESLELTDKEKAEFKECNRKIREYRQRKQDAKLLNHPRSQGVTWKSPYSEELRSQILTEKYVFHIPANRQIKRFKMDGLEMAASTMDDIIEGTCDIIEPLYKLQYQRVMKATLLAADGSPIPVLDNEKHKTVKQYMIEYRSIDTGIPVFLSTPPMEGIKGVSNGRGRKIIETNLSEWAGQALMCDAYAGYDWVKKAGRVLCRCSAHERRKFEAALKENPTLAKIGMVHNQQFYAVEEMIRAIEKETGRKMTAEEKIRFRNDNARPLWETLRLWCAKEILNLPQESKIYEAMNYLLRHYDELTAYLDIADMPLDNTDTERSIRDMVMGKKAYLYCRNYESVDRACVMYSLFGACKVLGKNPERWLTYVLKHIDSTPKEDLRKLLPEEWEDA